MLRKTPRILRRFRITPRRYQSHIPESDEIPDPKEEHMPERFKHQIEKAKETLQWRTPFGDRPGEWNSKLKSFADMEQTADFMTMQKDLDFSPSGIKRWWRNREERTERYLQQFIPERHITLGADLAAAHFINHRGGSVKFYHEQDWRKADKNGELNLPSKLHPAWKLEGIRCDNMNLYYEGLENIRCLEWIKFLSFRNVQPFDNWCLDRVAGGEYPKLEVLDISKTRVTAVGLQCLYRIPSLKLLVVDNPKSSVEYELACALIEEAIPNLKVLATADVDGEETKV